MTPHTSPRPAVQNSPVQSPSVQDNSLDQFQDVLDYTTKRFGAECEAAALLSVRLAELEAERVAANMNVESTADISRRHADQQAAMLSDGLMKSPVLMVGLGMAILAAMMGFSTLFIGMLAAKWLAL